jgi:Emfourin
MQITLKRSGGFMGRSLQTELDTATLPAEDEAFIEQLLTQLDFQALPLQPQDPRGADRFMYELTVADGQEIHTRYFSDEDVSLEVQQLVRHLMRLSRESGTDFPAGGAGPSNFYR